MPFSMAGYDLVHHGEGAGTEWPIASRGRCRGNHVIELRRRAGAALTGPRMRSPKLSRRGECEQSADEARHGFGRLAGGVRVVSIYAPNGRPWTRPSKRAKLAWFDRTWLAWLRED